MSDLHIGITPWRLKGPPEAESLCQQAELAENWGYDSFFLPENHFSPAAPIPDPLMLLAAVAGRTSRIQLGTTSWLLPIRNALLAAEQAAVLDQLCSGRLVLGLGRGFQPGMLERFGVKPQDKRSIFQQVLDAMIDAWSDEAVTPAPVQRPHPPLWVAAFGPKAIAQVAGLGLPYLASPLETTAELIDNYRLYDESASLSQSIIPVMRTVFICEDRKQCERVRQQLADSQWRDSCMVGSFDEVEQQVSLYREQLGMTHLIATRPRISGLDDKLITGSAERLLAMRGLDRAAPA